MTELYLICHKVRGEAAFDIASKLQIGDEVGWIVPTSGHRAYPFWSKKLSEFIWGLDPAVLAYEGFPWSDLDDVPPMPSALRDHYSVEAQPKAPINLAELDL